MRGVLALIFALSYAGISARRVALLPVGRPAMALIGASAMLVAGAFAGSHGLSPDEGLRAVEPHTLALLFGMMVVAAGLGEGGFFAWLARLLVARVRGPVAMLYAVTIGCGLLSAFLVNDAVCLLATPLVMSVADALHVARRPFVFAVAMGSNAGSALTLSGNPQNMLVANLSGLHYRDYLAAAFLPTSAALGLTALLLHAMHRRELGERAPAREEVAPVADIDRSLLVVSLVALAGIAIANTLGGSLALSALAFASIVLAWARQRAQHLLGLVDWSVLVFFAALFILVAGLQKTGLPASWLAHVPAASGTTGAVLLTSVLVIGSQVVSNVPLILLLAPWIRGLDDPRLAWTLTALASTLAGNLTLLGSVANVIVIERSGERLGFFAYLRVGVPVTLVSTAVAVAVAVAMRS